MNKNSEISLFLYELFSHAGLNKNDMFILHSSLTPLIWNIFEKFGKIINEKIFLDWLVEFVSPKGTLLLPAFNINIKKTVRYDFINTPSEMGILSEKARLDKRFQRTQHPLLSFLVFGKYKKEICELDDITGIGKNSPFDFVKKNNGKIAVISLPDNKSMSFYHHVENITGVSHRHLINFKSKIFYKDNFIKNKNYQYYARKRDEGVVTSVDKMEEYLWKRNVYLGTKYGDPFSVRSGLAKDIFYYTKKIIKSGKALGYLYKINR